MQFSPIGICESQASHFLEILFANYLTQMPKRLANWLLSNFSKAPSMSQCKTIRKLSALRVMAQPSSVHSSPRQLVLSSMLSSP